MGKEDDWENQVIKIILPAKLIPLGQIVTKAKGDATFTIKDIAKLIVYDIDGNREIITVDAKDGQIFISKYNKHYTAIDGDSLLGWVTTQREYFDYLRDLAIESS